ncbi:MAG: zinc ABC transporter substrate-binding protein [Chloroflexi bacterium]|nr:zinc ABC transporter substrate-binding protein [Chloroflexota bacterium]
MAKPLALALALIVALAVAVIGPSVSSAQPAARAASQPSAQARAVRVVVGMGIVKDLVEQVGRDRVEVFSVVPAGADPHTYQPTPRDIQSMQGARLAVWNGLGIDDTAADLVAEQLLPDLTTVVLSAGVTPMAGSQDEDEDTHGHAHAEGNPHLWLDPMYAIAYVETIRDTLSEVDPAGADTYRANATAYIGEIAALDAWAKGEIAKLPAERRKLVTFHDAFPYFAAHYDLELIGVVVKSPGREPSAQEVAALVTEIRSHNIPTVFAEPQFNARILELAARDAGVEVKRLYSDAFDSQVKTYLDLLRFNVTSVVEGLNR